MTKEEIIFYINYSLGWLIPASYGKEVSEVKKELGL
jgi:hypothetical protein